MMYEGRNIHYSTVDNKPLCSHSAKICRQRRLQGYGLCIRHILEDVSAPFKQCQYTAKSKNMCTNSIPKDQDRNYCGSHMQKLGLAERKPRRPSKDSKSVVITPKSPLINASEVSDSFDVPMSPVTHSITEPPRSNLEQRLKTKANLFQRKRGLSHGDDVDNHDPYTFSDNEGKKSTKAPASPQTKVKCHEMFNLEAHRKSKVLPQQELHEVSCRVVNSGTLPTEVMTNMAVVNPLVPPSSAQLNIAVALQQKQHQQELLRKQHNQELIKQLSTTIAAALSTTQVTQATLNTTTKTTAVMSNQLAKFYPELAEKLVPPKQPSVNNDSGAKSGLSASLCSDKLRLEALMLGRQQEMLQMAKVKAGLMQGSLHVPKPKPTVKPVRSQSKPKSKTSKVHNNTAKMVNVTDMIVASEEFQKRQLLEKLMSSPIKQKEITNKNDNDKFAQSVKNVRTTNKSNSKALQKRLKQQVNKPVAVIDPLSKSVDVDYNDHKETALNDIIAAELKPPLPRPTGQLHQPANGEQTIAGDCGVGTSKKNAASRRTNRSKSASQSLPNQVTTSVNIPVNRFTPQMPCSTPTTPDDCTSVRSLQGDTKMISSRQRRHTIGWSGGPGSSPVKNQQATNPVSPKKSEKSPQHQPDMLQPPYPNQAVTPSDDMGQGPRKTCCTRPRTADDVMTEIEARKRLKRRSTVKLYAYHANQRLYNNDLLGLGLSSSDDDSDNDRFPLQDYWFNTDSDDSDDMSDAEDLHINTSILKDIRCTKLSLKSDRMRRYLTQSKHHRLANSKRNAYDTKALLALIEAARYSLVDTSETLLLTVPASDRLAMSRKLKHKTTATLANEKRASARHKKKIRKRFHDDSLHQRYCLHENEGSSSTCHAPALPYTNHCKKHIMYNVDQQLYDYCTAKFSNNTQCCSPVIDYWHELPLCKIHGEKADNYNKTGEIKKRPKKKTRQSALTRPPKKGKKRKPIRRQKPIQAAPTRTKAPVTRPIPPQSCATKQPTIQSSQTVNHVNNHKIVTNGKNNALCDEEENVQIDEPPLSPNVIDKSFELPMSSEQSKFLEDSDLNNVLEEAFDMLTGGEKNGGYDAPTETSGDSLQNALMEVTTSQYRAMPTALLPNTAIHHNPSMQTPLNPLPSSSHVLTTGSGSLNQFLSANLPAGSMPSSTPPLTPLCLTAPTMTAQRDRSIRISNDDEDDNLTAIAKSITANLSNAAEPLGGSEELEDEEVLDDTSDLVMELTSSMTACDVKQMSQALSLLVTPQADNNEQQLKKELGVVASVGDLPDGLLDSGQDDFNLNSIQEMLQQPADTAAPPSYDFAVSQSSNHHVTQQSNMFLDQSNGPQFQQCDMNLPLQTVTPVEPQISMASPAKPANLQAQLMAAGILVQPLEPAPSVDTVPSTNNGFLHQQFSQPMDLQTALCLALQGNNNIINPLSSDPLEGHEPSAMVQALQPDVQAVSSLPSIPDDLGSALAAASLGSVLQSKDDISYTSITGTIANTNTSGINSLANSITVPRPLPHTSTLVSPIGAARPLTFTINQGQLMPSTANNDKTRDTSHASHVMTRSLSLDQTILNVSGALRLSQGKMSPLSDMKSNAPVSQAGGRPSDTLVTSQHSTISAILSTPINTTRHLHTDLQASIKQQSITSGKSRSLTSEQRLTQPNNAHLLHNMHPHVAQNLLTIKHNFSAANVRHQNLMAEAAAKQQQQKDSTNIPPLSLQPQPNVQSVAPSAVSPTSVTGSKLSSQVDTVLTQQDYNSLTSVLTALQNGTLDTGLLATNPTTDMPETTSTTIKVPITSNTIKIPTTSLTSLNPLLMKITSNSLQSPDPGAQSALKLALNSQTCSTGNVAE